MIILSGKCQEAIRMEGEKAWPNECCGALLGTLDDGDRRTLEAVIPVDNAREEAEQYHRFKIEAEDLMRAERAARARNLELLGFYHSHPDHPARPSGYDLESALPFYSYIIVSVEKSKAAEMSCWRLSADRKEFLEEAIQEEA